MTFLKQHIPDMPVSAEMQQRMQGLRRSIKSLDVDIQQIPSSDNQDTAVCRATLTNTDNQRFSDVGSAQGSPDDRDSTICEASMKAQCRVLHRANVLQDDGIFDTVSRPVCATQGAGDITAGSPSVHPKAALNGGGSKPASAPQLQLLSTLARERNRSVESLSQNTFGKMPVEMSGAQANQLIQQLKQKG